MPYKKISEANVKALDGCRLSLAQANKIASMADAIDPKDKSKSWAIAISQFKKSHHIEHGKWVKNDKEEKSLMFIEKENNRYQIITISTAAFPDYEGETFSTQAMDFDIALAEQSKQFPDFCLFHKRSMKIGKVEKMVRVGKFMVDIGYSNDDDFSREVCEKMLLNNDGKWRVSRGFYPFEYEGKCNNCNAMLGVTYKQVRVGVRCPNCKAIHLTKEGLQNVTYKAVQTFDVTITDNPCVPATSAQAFKLGDNMTKEELKEKLLAAGVNETAIDTKLATIEDAELKELSEIPEAVLKELPVQEEPEKTDEPEDVEEPEETMTLEEVKESLKEFISTILTETIAKQEQMHNESKTVLESEISTLKERIAKLESDAVENLKELKENAPRMAQTRIIRAGKPEPKVDEAKPVEKELNTGIVDGEGKTYANMTEFITKK